MGEDEGAPSELQSPGPCVGGTVVAVSWNVTAGSAAECDPALTGSHWANNGSETGQVLEVGAALLFQLWAIFASISLFGGAIFWMCGMEKRYRASFYKYQTYRRQTRNYFLQSADDGLDLTLSTRDPYYWPPPDFLIA